MANPRTTKPLLKQFILHLELPLVIYDWFSGIRTFLSIFAENHVADSIFDFLDYFAEHVADVFGLFCQNHVADVFLMKIVGMEIIQENFYYS